MNNIYQLAQIFEESQIMDLSHTLEENIPMWHTHTKFTHSKWSSMKLGDGADSYMIVMNEHNGTHMDMPSHVIKEGEMSKLTTENLPLEHFQGIYKLIDCTEFRKGQLLEKDYVVEWEAKYGLIEEANVVLINFGWAKYWKLKPDDKAYADNWPGIGVDAAEYFVEKKIKIVGVDTLAADILGAKGSPAHQLLLGNKICIAENLNNLDKIKREGFFIAQPLKMKDGTASPIRPFAIY